MSKRTDRPRSDDEFVFEYPYLSTGAAYSVNEYEPDEPKRIPTGFGKPQIQIAKVYRPRGRRPK